ncbi:MULTISPECIES: type I CRISPR-associated protein Cas7 [Fusobacterium]|jgi:CRISPR-associated protein Csh2|uniref:CRISPR-associated protein n=1 Tax=Fusobacterium varium ATCC 27725 TaxID=469618 RepID=A0ABM6U6D8_FUSVA|nr:MULTISPECIES: type I CRISPR-associated protein Cas7 [Fusobacterium]AVQ31951.1 CRISPR-associated protein [Fusobacterium varium ATCC 27725]EES63308.1 CRISPR-associated protein, CT1132 family [Fusobacterium varium ATCC 27725]HBJ79690.1 CRISPR-associated protein [Fusobacterium sp.]
MKNRVYGIIGVKSIMANWNADFEGYPKTISSGETFGSDKALKYPMKKMWEAEGEKVLYIKSLKVDSGEGKKGEIAVRPKSLRERYDEIFETNLKEEKDKTNVIKNLFKAIDVKNFGATFAEEKNNASITGAVQIGQGFNKYVDTYPEEQQILSPFRDSSKDEKEGEANQSTLGTKIVSNEAHYFYPFVINPQVYKDFVKMGMTEGYTEEDYKKFKDAALTSATFFNSNSKLGCENEFALFIEVKEGYYLPELAQYVKFSKEKDYDVIELGFDELINQFKDNILSVEIYYNTLNVKVKHNIKGAKEYNIFTRKEV